MEYIYETKGTCSTKMVIEIEENQIKKLTILGGCPGNTAGIAKLVEGMHIDEVIQKLEGIPCKTRGTSCPDQLAKALKEIKENCKIKNKF